MKLKKVIAILKSQKWMNLIDDGEYQWLSDGYAAYLLDDNMPRLDIESMKSVFDLSDSEQEKIYFRHDMEGVPGIDLSDSVECENELEDEFPRLCVGGDRIIAFSTTCGIRFINSMYLTPFAGEYRILKYYERQTEKGDTYIAVKTGMILRAVIGTMNIANQDYYERMERMLAMYKIELDKHEQGEAKNNEDLYGQEEL